MQARLTLSAALAGASGWYEATNNPDYPSIAARSASGVVIGAILNFSTNTESTDGVTKAGRLGPRRMFLMPRCKSVSGIATRATPTTPLSVCRRHKRRPRQPRIRLRLHRLDRQAGGYPPPFACAFSKMFCAFSVWLSFAVRPMLKTVIAMGSLQRVLCSYERHLLSV